MSAVGSVDVDGGIRRIGEDVEAAGAAGEGDGKGDAFAGVGFDGKYLGFVDWFEFGLEMMFTGFEGEELSDGFVRESGTVNSEVGVGGGEVEVDVTGARVEIIANVPGAEVGNEADDGEVEEDEFPVFDGFACDVDGKTDGTGFDGFAVEETSDILGKVESCVVTVVGSFLHRFHADGGDVAVDFAVDLMRDSRIFGRDFLEDGEDVVAFEHRDGGEHFVEGNAKGENVGATVSLGTAAGGLFRGHVAWRAHDLTGDGEFHLLAVFAFGNAEVSNFDLTGLIEENVTGFDVAMDDAVFVGVVQGFGSLADEFKGFTRRNRAAGDTVSQRFAFDEIHREEILAVLCSEIVDRNDIRVLQFGGGLCFFEEPFDVFATRGRATLENFQRDDAIKAALACPVDDADAAACNLAKDFVLSELGKKNVCRIRRSLVANCLIVVGHGSVRFYFTCFASPQRCSRS